MGHKFTQDVLRAILAYEPDTGGLIWLPRTGKFYEDSAGKTAAGKAASWNGIYAGKPALTAVSEGYFKGSVLGINAFAHRIIWTWMTGEHPLTIDHINGDRKDNRWGNLRNVDTDANRRNVRYPQKRDGLPTRVKQRRGRYEVSIGKKQQWVGSFLTVAEAVEARDAAYRAAGYHPNHATRPIDNPLAQGD